MHPELPLSRKVQSFNLNVMLGLLFPPDQVKAFSTSSRAALLAC